MSSTLVSSFFNDLTNYIPTVQMQLKYFEIVQWDSSLKAKNKTTTTTKISVTF